MPVDSLQLRLIQLEILESEDKVHQTSFSMRLIPQMHLSHTFAVRDIVLTDPNTLATVVAPKDDYRLTLSFSLNRVFDSSEHANAILQLERLRTQLIIRTAEQVRSQRLFDQKHAELDELLESLAKEQSLVVDLLHFDQMRFEQGVIEFDALTRRKLELLSVQRSIQQIRNRIAELSIMNRSGDLK